MYIYINHYLDSYKFHHSYLKYNKKYRKISFIFTYMDLKDKHQMVCHIYYLNKYRLNNQIKLNFLPVKPGSHIHWNVVEFLFWHVPRTHGFEPQGEMISQLNPIKTLQKKRNLFNKLTKHHNVLMDIDKSVHLLMD